MALRECARDVLRGDFRICDEVKKLTHEVTSSQRSELEKWRYHTAVEEANGAFRSKDYQRVVGVLVPYEDRLTPAQRLNWSLQSGNVVENMPP